MGSLSPINDLAGVLIQQYSDDLEETIEMVVQQELVEAKEEGLKGVQCFVDSWRYSDDYVYRLEAISLETANKLLRGEFKTIEQVATHKYETKNFSKGVFVLYREVENKIRDEKVAVIEALFLEY